MKDTADTPKFESLASALSGWYDKPFKKLPDDLGSRVEGEWGLRIYWDDLTEREREDAAKFWDLEHDPATKAKFPETFGWFCKLHELKTTGSQTFWEHSSKMKRLPELSQDLNQVREKIGWAFETLEACAAGELVPFLKAEEMLTKRFNATCEEIAMWVMYGRSDGGLDGYWPGPVQDRFRFPDPNFDKDGNYLGPTYADSLTHCCFKVADVESFEPLDRYLTHAQLVELLRKHIPAKANVIQVIRDYVESGKLYRYHPVFGCVIPGMDEEGIPPIQESLFSVAQLKSIEGECFLLSGLAIPDEDVAVAQTEAAPWKVKALQYADEIARDYLEQPFTLTKEDIAAKVAERFRKEGIKGPRGPLSSEYIRRHGLEGWRKPQK